MGLLEQPKVTMPGRTLPTILQADVRSRNTPKSCYVTIGTNVYDITPFLDDHPGGGSLILEYGGKDVTKIMKDEISHGHSEAAYEILEEHLVGFVATDLVMKSAVESQHPDTILPLPPRENEKEPRLGNSLTEANSKQVYSNTGMSSAEDLSIETDFTTDFRTHKFLDLSRPMFPQLWNGGFSRSFYLEQVHRPRHYKGGKSAPLFGNFLEPLSKTSWWVVPLVWLPPVAYGTFLAFGGLPTHEALAYWLFGLGLWTLVEYILHRGLFHVDKSVIHALLSFLLRLTWIIHRYLPDNRVGITLHFLLHGIHHYLPMDKLRLVMPPALFIILATPFYHLAYFLFSYDWYAATAVLCGGIFGYICYDLTHYFLHHRT